MVQDLVRFENNIPISTIVGVYYNFFHPSGMYLHWRNDAVFTGWLYVVQNFANIGWQKLNICRDGLRLSAVAIELF